MPDVIVELPGNTYDVFVLIQDGTEFCGSCSTLEEARKHWKECQWVLNHNKKVKLSDVPVVPWDQVKSKYPFGMPTPWVTDNTKDIPMDDKWGPYEDDYYLYPYNEPAAPPKKKKATKKPIKKPATKKKSPPKPKEPTVVPSKKKIELDLD